VIVRVLLCDCNARSELNLGVQPAGFTVVKSYRPTDDHKDYLRVLLTYIFIMAARQLAGRRPLYFTEVCFYPLTYFFRRLISETSGPIVTTLCHMFVGDCSL